MVSKGKFPDGWHLEITFRGETIPFDNMENVQLFINMLNECGCYNNFGKPDGVDSKFFQTKIVKEG